MPYCPVGNRLVLDGTTRRSAKARGPLLDTLASRQRVTTAAPHRPQTMPQQSRKWLKSKYRRQMKTQFDKELFYQPGKFKVLFLVINAY
jgi:hypothetical protein